MILYSLKPKGIFTFYCISKTIKELEEKLKKDPTLKPDDYWKVKLTIEELHE